MRITKKITSIVLAVLMVVSMMSVMAISASATDYVNNSVVLDDLVAGDTLSAESGDYLALINSRGSDVIIKGGTYREIGGSGAKADDTEFQAEQIEDMIIENDAGASVLTVFTAEDLKHYYALDANGNVSDKWYVLSNENNTLTLAGHVPAAPVDYYIVGTMNDWEISDAYKLDKNPEENGEYMFTDLTVSANTELKVKDSNGAFYPDGMGNNFTLNAAGTYDLYFRPNGNGGGLWYYGTIFANNYRPAETFVAQISDAIYTTLDSAIAAVSAGETIELLENVTLTEPLVIPEGKNFTLDLNGKDITGNVNDKLVKNNGTVVVDDSTEAPGHIYNTNIDKQGNAAFVNYGTATVKNGYFGDKNSDMTDANDVNRGAGFQNHGTAVIDGGYFTACDNFTNTEGTGNGYAYAIINYGNITINDATVYGKNNGNLANDEGTMVVNGGTYTLNKPSKKNVYYSIYNGSADANTTVNAGTFTNNGAKALLYTGEGSTEIKGGTFTGPKIEQSTGAPAISGGTFNKAVPADFCSDGYIPEDNGDGTYGVTPHTHDYTTPSFNWAQDANGDWNCDTLTLTCSCGDTQTYEVTGFFGASAVTVTANADGSFTYSVSKKVDGVTYTDTKTNAANGVIKSTNQLKAAAKKGGAWELGSDLTGVTDVQCANGFVLDGKDHTVTRHANVSTQAVFRTTTNPAEVTLKSLTIDGIAGQSDSKPAIATKQSNPSDGNVINLENVTITNYDFDASNNGVVLAWGQATVNMKNCTVDTDSDYDVWGGAASTINVDGGKVGTAYLNGGTAEANLANGAVVDSFAVPEGKKIKDNGNGTYTVVEKVYVAQVGDNKYESLAEAITAAQDGDTIKVLRNFTTAQTDIPAGKELTLDLGGYTVSGGSPIRVFGTLTIENGTISATDRAIQSVGTTTIEADAKIIAGNVGYLGFPGSVVYMDGEIEMTSAKDALVVQASGAKAYVSGRITTAGTAVNALGPCEVELKDGAYISGCTYGVYASLADPVGPTVVVRDGVTINATSYAITGNGSENRGKTTITIEGGELHGDDAAIFHPQEGTLTITGGTLEGGKNGIYMKSGTANISGGTIKGLGEKVDYEFKDSGWYPTGDAFTVDNSDYPGGVPSVTITGGTFISENADAVASYAKPGLTAIDHFVSGGYFSNRVDGSLCVEDCFSVGSALKPGMYIVDSLKNFEINADNAKDVDSNAFDLSGKYNKGTILGVQRKDKASVDARITSDSKQETGNDLRFVAVLDTEILNAADDYGFVLAKVTDGTKTYNTTNTVFDNLKKGDDRAKTISAKDTYNNVCGDELYGDPTDTTTAYKYITCAVNGLSDTDKVATRFYVTIDGKTYYAQYAGYNYAYTGCTAGMSLLG